jgi:hypothetical protein
MKFEYLFAVRILIIPILLSTPSFAGAKNSYEGTWFSCILAVEGQPIRRHVASITLQGDKLEYYYDWGTKHSFLGNAIPARKELVVRGCFYYVDQPFVGCDPADPPVTQRFKLPINKTRPVNLDKALARGDSIYVRENSKDLDTFTKRCKQIIKKENKKTITIDNQR